MVPVKLQNDFNASIGQDKLSMGLGAESIKRHGCNDGGELGVLFLMVKNAKDAAASAKRDKDRRWSLQTASADAG